MRKILLIIIVLWMDMSCYGAEAFFSYTNGCTPDFFGYEKSESCDIAIFIPGSSLADKEITGLQVAIPDNVELTNLSGWLSSDLILKRENGKYVNRPDICISEAQLNNGVLEVIFDKPYTITSDGVYAGYSFTQGGIEKCIATTPGDNTNGFWFHGSRSKMKWTSLSNELGLTSALEIMFKGDFADNAASWKVGELPKVSLEEEAIIDISVVNYGLKPIDSITYAYDTPQGSGNGQINLNPAIPAILGACAQVQISLGNFHTLGPNSVRIEMTYVNGQPNDDINFGAEFSLTAIPFIPVNRPLFEEYTGLWCGWCPRGFVAMEAMKEMHPDHFVGVSYHQEDAMQFVSPIANASTMGLPTSFVNRSINMDPGQIYGVWDNYRANIPEASVELSLIWSDDEKSDIQANATVRFVEDHENASYRIGYILIADSLTSPYWLHANNYSGLKPEDYPTMLMPWAEVFFKGDKKVGGLVYNDIAIAASDFDGVAGSIPSTVEAGIRYSHTYTFNFTDLENSGAASIVNDLSMLRAVAVVTNARTGEFVNCVSSPYIGKTNCLISQEMSHDMFELERFSIEGRKLDNPQKGINIVRYSDGTTRKVLVRE